MSDVYAKSTAFKRMKILTQNFIRMSAVKFSNVVIVYLQTGVYRPSCTVTLCIDTIECLYMKTIPLNIMTGQHEKLRVVQVKRICINNDVQVLVKCKGLYS